MFYGCDLVSFLDMSFYDSDVTLFDADVVRIHEVPYFISRCRRVHDDLGTYTHNRVSGLRGHH